MKAKQTATSLDFEPVWGALRKTSRLIKELYETQKETERLAMENARQVEKLGGYFGGMFGYPVNPYLMRYF